MKEDNEDKSWFTCHEWDEDHHQEFYAKLKELSPEDQSKALLTQASMLTLHGDKHHANYQAAESLINFWMKNLANAEQVEMAKEIINDLQKRMHS